MFHECMSAKFTPCASTIELDELKTSVLVNLLGEWEKYHVDVPVALEEPLDFQTEASSFRFCILEIIHITSTHLPL